MSERLPDLVQNFVLNTDGYEIGSRRVGQAASNLRVQFDKTAQSAAKAETVIHSFGRSFRESIITLGALRFALMDLDDFLLAFPKSIAKVGGEFQRLEALMTGLSKSTDEATRKLEGLRDMAEVISFAKTSPFEVNAIADAFVKLKSAGIDPAGGAMSALTNEIAKFGGNSDTFKRAAVAIQQMAGKGVISMEELRQQLGEAVPNAIRLMADGMGMSVADLTAKVSKGVVKANYAIAKMFIQMQLDSAGAAEKMLDTLPGAFERLKTEFSLFQNVVANQGFLSTLTAIAKQLTEAFQSPEGVQFAKNIGVALRDAVESLMLLAKWVAENTGLLKMLGLALLSVYGGSKVAGAFTNLRSMFADIRAQQQKVFDDATAAHNRQMAELKKRGEELDRQSVKAQIAAQKAREDAAAEFQQKRQALESSKNTQLGYLQAVRTTARNDYLEELQRMKSLQAELSKVQSAMNAVKSLQAPVGVAVVQGGPAERNRLPASSASAALLRAPNIQDNVRNLEAEIAASKRLVEAKGQVLKQAGDMVIAKGSETAAYVANFGAVDREVERTKRLAESHAKLTEQMSKLGPVAKTSGSAIASFALSLAANIGWAAAFSAAVSALTWVVDKFTESARRAEAAKLALDRAKKGQSVEGDDNAIQAQVVSLEEKIATTKRQIENLQFDQKASGRSNANIQKLIDEKTADIARFNNQIAELNRQKQDVVKNLGTAASLNVAQSLFSSLEREFTAKMNANELISQSREIDARRAKLSVESPEYKKLTEQLKENGKKLAIANLETWNQLSKATQDGSRNLGEVERNALNRLIADRTSSLVQSRELVLKEGKDLFTAGKVTAPKAERGPSSYEQFMKERKIRLDELRADTAAVSEGIVTSASLYAKATDFVRNKVLEQNVGDKGSRGLNSKEFGEAVEAEVLLSKQEILKKALDSVNSLRIDLIAKRDAALSELTAGVKDPESEGLAKFIASLERYRPILQGTSADLDVLKNEFAGLNRATTEAKFIKKMMDETKKLEDDAAASAKERDEIRLKQKLDNIDKELAAQVAYYNQFEFLTDEQQKRYEELVQSANKNKLAVKAAFDANQTKIEVKQQRSAIQELAETWENSSKQMQQATVTLATNIMSEIERFVIDGKFRFVELRDAYKKEVIGTLLKRSLGNSVQQLAGGLSDFLGGIFGIPDASGLAGVGAAAPKYDSTGAQLVRVVNPPSSMAEMGATTADKAREVAGAMQNGMSKLWDGFKSIMGTVLNNVSDYYNSRSSDGSIAGFISSFFANGGIMTGSGPIPLRKYANGGIARSAQLAVFGEGSMPEAFVPLPDGKRIPVQMAQAAGGSGSAPSVTMNVINQSGTPVNARQQNIKFNGRDMILDVVLEAASQPGGFRDGLRGAVK